MQIKTILLFDIDGTLVITGGAGMVSFEAAFNVVLDIQKPFKRMNLSGMTDGAIIDEVVQRHLGRKATKNDHQKIHKYYTRRMTVEIENFRPCLRIMPGILQLLTELEGQPAVSGLATGNYVEAAQMKLEAADLWHRFDFGGFGSDAKNRADMTRIAIQRGLDQASTHIPNNRIWVIGDSIRDIQAAQANGVNCLAVATGWTSMDELKQHHPTALLQTLEDTNEVLKVFGMRNNIVPPPDVVHPAF